MKVAGYIPLDRKNPHSRRNVMKECGNRIDNGKSVFFYPEGTRSKTGQLKPFHNGAFQLAIEKKIGIQPMVLSGTKTLFIKGGGIPGVARVKLKILPFIPYDESCDKETLKKKCWDAIHQELEKI